jgi:hypothetical protein
MSGNLWNNDRQDGKGVLLYLKAKKAHYDVINLNVLNTYHLVLFMMVLILNK